MKKTLRPLLCGLAAVMAVAAATPVLAQDARKVDPDHLSAYWILLNTKVNADIPNTGRNMDKPGCASVSYQVGSDGLPMNIELKKVAPESDLGSVAVSIVKNLRYGPSLTNRHSEPVATYYIVPFNMPADAAAKAKLIAACQLPGYGQG
ncbi:MULTISPECIES: energy transducer TonB [Dyella]|uniref:Energy transducer TonB n=2 Tax=Dyella TaxID=231454 RepID=A0A4R0YYV3_9GAMM|nr:MULTISPECIES: energy transducer TonB [Dyella]TBR40442.1 energy transducer TonB [Dyella terrae]TCI11976.1 energy transducer TonB [Dyella soli]